MLQNSSTNGANQNNPTTSNHMNGTNNHIANHRDRTIHNLNHTVNPTIVVRIQNGSTNTNTRNTSHGNSNNRNACNGR